MHSDGIQPRGVRARGNLTDTYCLAGAAMCAPASDGAAGDPIWRIAVATGNRAENFSMAEKGRLGGDNAL